MKTKRNKNQKRKSTRKKTDGGFFEWFNKKNSKQNITLSNETIVYLDPIKNSNVWGCVYLPPFKSTSEICDRIDEISNALINNGILTKCKFNIEIQNRINTIINYSNDKYYYLFKVYKNNNINIKNEFTEK
jgi:hypothetical protein